ncbi:MAG: hypothetical protein JWR80_6989 [Bradyrhizobium sp.]|nr:hypothetical protein [Bradyrhizobium sp.]
MEQAAHTFPRFERSGFAAAVVACCGMLLLIGIAPRSERALFLKDDSGVPAKAFSAVVPPLDATRSQIERSLLNTVGSRNSRSGEGQTSPAQRQFVASNQSLLPGSLPGLLSAGPAAGAAPAPGEAAPPSGVPSAPTGGQSTTPTTPTTTSNPPAAPGLPAPTGGAPSAGTPNPGTPDPGTPVSAVPEPGSWAMMLLGFLAIGFVTRRRQVPRGVSTAATGG